MSDARGSVAGRGTSSGIEEGATKTRTFLDFLKVRVPALRGRLDDLEALASHFLAEFCTRNSARRKRLHPDVVPLLARYHWPGNIHELRNIVERIAILSSDDTIAPEAVTLEIRDRRSPAGHRANESAQADARARCEAGW